MIFTFILIFIFTIVITVLVLSVFSNRLFPKKLNEIAQMIAQGQTKIAIKKLTEIIEKDDRNHYARFLLAEAYRKENNMQYAILEYRQVLKMNTYDDNVQEKDIRLKMAKIFQKQKRLTEAKKEYLILTKMDSTNYEYYYELGKIFLSAGVLEKALGYFKKSASLNPKHEQSFYNLGQIYYKSGAQSEAKQAFVQSIKLDAQNYKSHYFLGLVLRQQGDYEWAVKEFEIAQKDESIKVKCFLAKGTCFLEKEQYPKAIIELERGLKYTRRGSDSELNLRYFLAESHEKLRDLHSAISNWEKIYSVNKGFRDVAKKLKNYQEFRQDDSIKDFMIAGLANFEHTSRKIVEGMGFQVSDVNIISDTDIEIIAVEAEGKWRNTRRTNQLVRIIRTTDTVSEKLLRQLHQSMKPKNASRVILICTGDVSDQALSFSNTRPIEVVGKSKLVELLKSVS